MFGPVMGFLVFSRTFGANPTSLVSHVPFHYSFLITVHACCRETPLCNLAITFFLLLGSLALIIDLVLVLVLRPVNRISFSFHSNCTYLISTLIFCIFCENL